MDVLRTFIQYGFNVESCDDEGQTPLDLAKEGKHEECIKLLTGDKKLTLVKTDINLEVSEEIFGFFTDSEGVPRNV